MLRSINTGSFLIPVAKYLSIASKFKVLVTFQAYGQLTRYGPFDKLSFKSFHVTSLGLPGHIMNENIWHHIMDLKSIIFLQSAPVFLF